jgi:hypothetical protein
VDPGGQELRLNAHRSASSDWLRYSNGSCVVLPPALLPLPRRFRRLFDISISSCAPAPSQAAR